MKRRPIPPWQLAKQRTAKGLLALPKCEECRIKRGMGFARDGRWLCVECAAAVKVAMQKMSRHDAPRES